jgi:hypothetical protein
VDRGNGGAGITLAGPSNNVEDNVIGYKRRATASP